MKSAPYAGLSITGGVGYGYEAELKGGALAYGSYLSWRFTPNFGIGGAILLGSAKDNFIGTFMFGPHIGRVAYVEGLIGLVNSTKPQPYDAYSFVPERTESMPGAGLAFGFHIPARGFWSINPQVLAAKNFKDDHAWVLMGLMGVAVRAPRKGDP